VLVYFKPGLCFDPCAGSGAARDVCEELGVPCFSFDIHQGFDACDPNDFPDANTFDFIWAHPPYWRQKIYADDARDMSRSPTLEHFLRRYGQFIRNCARSLKPGGKLAILMGDYSDRDSIRNGAKVIVCTIETIRDAEGDVEASVKEAEKAGVLFVRAAGNRGSNIDNDQERDFLAPLSNVLIVGATIRDGTLSPHMNFGKLVGIAAPSVDMVFPSFNGYERAKGPGTSFSTAIVAGVAGTLLSQEPDLTPAQVIARLKKASVIAPGMEDKISGGRLDMAKLFSP
jgi:SAM-dependent methyltransferase